MLHLFLNSALVGGEWLTSGSGRFIPEGRTQILILCEAGRAPYPFRTFRKQQESLISGGSIQPIAVPSTLLRLLVR